jgi:hypothetical protein
MGRRHDLGTLDLPARFWAMANIEALPELALIRIAAIVSGYMAKGDAHEALSEIIAILEHSSVPWPASPEQRALILDRWRNAYLAGGAGGLRRGPWGP